MTSKPISPKAWESPPAQIVQWVMAAQAGDRAAFHHLADRFQPEIYRMVYYRLLSRLDAEDLTQDIFLQAFKNLVNLKKPQVFRPWLYRIAVNRVRDYFRRKKFKSLFGFISVDDEAIQHAPELAVASQADLHIDRARFWEQIGAALEKLSRMEREVFVLRFFDELSIKEITATLEKNESTIKTHLYRALRKMQKTLADLPKQWGGL